MVEFRSSGFSDDLPLSNEWIINENFSKVCDELLKIKDKELDESRGLMEKIIKDLRDKAIAPGEAELKFSELENLQGTNEEKKFKKAIRDFAMLQKNEKKRFRLQCHIRMRLAARAPPPPYLKMILCCS